MRKTAILVLAALSAGCASLPEGPTVADMNAVLDPPALGPEVRRGAEWIRQVLAREELTLEDALRLADVLNPELNMLRRDIDIAAAEVRNAALYPNPSLIAEVEDYRTRRSSGLSQAERVAGVEFPVVSSGRIGAATELAQKQRELAAWQYAWAVRRRRAEVKKAFAQVLAYQQYQALAEQNREVARAFHRVAEARFQAQAVPEMEVLKSAVALGKADADVRTVQAQVAVAIKSLKTRIGDPDLPFQRFSGTLHTKFEVPSFEAVKGRVLVSHPLIERARRAREMAEAELRLARAEAWPDVAVRVTSGKGPEDDTIVEGGLSVPLPLFNRNQWKVIAAEHKIRRAEFEIEATRNAVLEELSASYTGYTSAQDRVALYQQEILPKAEKALEQSEAGYRQGKFSYLDVLDAQRTVAEARIAYVFALLDLNQQAAELEGITGLALKEVR